MEVIERLIGFAVGVLIFLGYVSLQQIRKERKKRKRKREWEQRNPGYL